MTIAYQREDATNTSIPTIRASLYMFYFLNEAFSRSNGWFARYVHCFLLPCRYFVAKYLHPTDMLYKFAIKLLSSLVALLRCDRPKPMLSAITVDNVCFHANRARSSLILLCLKYTDRIQSDEFRESLEMSSHALDCLQFIQNRVYYCETKLL